MGKFDVPGIAIIPKQDIVCKCRNIPWNKMLQDLLIPRVMKMLLWTSLIKERCFVWREGKSSLHCGRHSLGKEEIPQL